MMIKGVCIGILKGGLSVFLLMTLQIIFDIIKQHKVMKIVFKALEHRKRIAIAIIELTGL
jgi:hypothetical protein